MARRATRSFMSLQDDCEDPTGETPFKLDYGSEAVIPAKVHMVN